MKSERRIWMEEDWKKAWQPMIEAIGKDFSDGKEHWGADPMSST